MTTTTVDSAAAHWRLTSLVPPITRTTATIGGVWNRAQGRGPTLHMDRMRSGRRPDTVTSNGFRAGRVSRFVLIGTAGTLLQLTLYVALTPLVGVVAATATSWLASTLTTNAAQAAVTFRHGGRRAAAAGQVVAFLSGVAALTVTTAVAAVVWEETAAVRLLALVASNAATGAARYLLLSWWHRDRPPAAAGPLSTDR